MNRREAERLCIQAVDGELSSDERRRLDAFLERDPELRAFLAEERAAAADADAAGATLRLPAHGLEETVLRRLGMQSSRGRRWLFIGAGVAAAAVVAVVLGGQAEPDTRAERRAFEPTAEFDAVAEAFDDGAYRLAEGTTNVEVEKPTVIQTPAGTIELVPGTYRITLAKNRVEVTVEKGRATVRSAATVF
ncbi:MAG: hypothetical protein OER88_13770, partial [Planctomycetota bacterium]|nr:hypothetical protein [Planctomycetota bacterium]